MKYAVVIDAGSSGSRAFVYSWPDPAEYLRDLSASSVLRKALLPVETQPTWVQRVQPGISSYSDASDSAIWKHHLQPVLQNAMKVVPSEKQFETPIFFLATAGLRLLEEQERNRLLRTVCTHLRKKTNFALTDCTHNVAMINGQTEGLYGWLGLNYLVHWGISQHWDRFDDTYGFLDMGGASAQLAYASSSESQHLNDLHKVRIRNAQGELIEWHVFVTTWLGFGANQARSRYRDSLVSAISPEEMTEYADQGAPIPVFDPCLPSGAQESVTKGELTYFFQGSGEWSQCEARVTSLLNSEVACPDEPCLFDGVHVPDFDIASGRFVGVSEYWYTLQDLFSFNGKFDFGSLEPRVAEFCSSDWSSIQAKLHNKEFLKNGNKIMTEQELQTACFKSAWVLMVLSKGFRFPMSPENPSLDHEFKDSFQSAMDIKGTEISWTLGRAVLYASSQIKPMVGTDPTEVGVTTLDGKFVPGGDPFNTEDKTSQSMGMSTSWVLLLCVCILAALTTCFAMSEFGQAALQRIPLSRRAKRTLRKWWPGSDSQRTAASRIGYGNSYPHAGIPLTDFDNYESQGTSSSRPSFATPSRVGSRQSFRHDRQSNIAGF